MVYHAAKMSAFVLGPGPHAEHLVRTVCRRFEFRSDVAGLEAQGYPYDLVLEALVSTGYEHINNRKRNEQS